MSTPTFFQKGLGLKAEVAPILAENYASHIVDRIRALDNSVQAGPIRLKLAREFGFCYGVDRAVEYAYQARERFPDRRLFISGEIIHNREVNARIERMGITILPPDRDPEARYAALGPDDVMILPAFGVTFPELTHLKSKGCVLVDTTCGSVMNVWKNVERYAREGFTSIIHGKHYHEETRATASQALAKGGHYLCVRDRDEAALVCELIEGSLDPTAFMTRFEQAVSDDFDARRHVERIGLANQTTMLMSESVEIQEMLRNAMRERWGEVALGERFRAFDTICSATQDRQDAVLKMLEDGGLDVMLVIGGFNSSNTIALTRICSEQLPTFHITGAESLEGESIRHKPVDPAEIAVASSWLPSGSSSVGLTAGASTPNNVVGEVVEKVLAMRGASSETLEAA